MGKVTRNKVTARAAGGPAGGAAPPYQGGFGNHFASEALPGALPQGRN
ncbi:MAG: homogentisate 1,2-dioxygenase, partial [Steroidobacteraceae bacterium]